MKREDVIARIEAAYIPLVNKLNNGDVATVGYGSKFAKIWAGRSVHTFIDLSNGDILKAATWRAPAVNGVRGNIFADDAGASCINHYGANYLR